VLLLAGVSFGAAKSQAQEGRKVVTQTQPEYPELAKRLRLQGTVKVQVIIGTDGIIKNTKVVGGNPVLVESTLEALKKWKYAPSSSETATTLEFSFRPPS
jgi:protein TonB